MKTKSLCFCFLFLCLAITLMAQTAPAIVWQKTIGGNDTDSMAAFCLAPNNTFVMCGSSKSARSGNKSAAHVGGYDYWVVKMDYAGSIIWDKTFGGKKDDIASAIIATSDGGYLVGGTSISDKSATKSANSFLKSRDFWVIKLDANGSKVWDKTLGGIFTEKLTALAELSSGKYVVGGYSFSDISGTKNSANLGSENTGDYWITMLDRSGNIKSQSVFGGSSMDALTSLSPAGAGSVYVAGYSYSLKYPNYKTKLPVGNNDFWFVRADTSGNIQYEGGFGGSRSDYLTSVLPLADKSLMIGGYSNSPFSGDKSGAFLGGTDYWLIKTKTDGTKQWDKTIGGAQEDYLVSVQQTRDKGYILGGYSRSNMGNNKTQNAKGGYDYWIVKTDSSGNVKWDKTIGGSGYDIISGIYEIDTNQFIVAGTSNSPASGDKSSKQVGTAGAADYWILRLGNAAQLNREVVRPMASLSSSDKVVSLSVIPNPVKNVLTIQYNTQGNDKVNFVIYSAAGSAVLQCALPSSASRSRHSFDIANLSKGIYYAVLLAGDEKVSKRFVKE